MPTFPKPYADAVQRLRVPFGFILAGALGWFSKPSPLALVAGVPLCLAGLLLRSWAAGHLRKNETLTMSGPYAWMRNPLYAGSLLLTAGFVIASGTPWLGVLFGAVFLLIYLPVIEQEEQHLRVLFPEFAGYAASVPLLWPKPPRVRPGARFSWDTWRRNQEYKAIGATAIGFALMALKAAVSS